MIIATYQYAYITLAPASGLTYVRVGLQDGFAFLEVDIGAGLISRSVAIDVSTEHTLELNVTATALTLTVDGTALAPVTLAALNTFQQMQTVIGTNTGRISLVELSAC